jgi:tyrosine-protein phosphatase YwqE
MFSFFTKKEYLVDYLEGFIDIHNHILPSIDDGAKNVEESIELIKGFGEFGVTDFVCTPHIMENYYPNTPETINNSLALLQTGLKKNDLTHVNISAAAEHMIDSGFEKRLKDKQIMPLGEKYLLVEMSYLQASINFEEATNYIMSEGYFSILAHPERYIFLHDNLEIYNQYKSQGILFQLNILSLSEYYGKEVQKIAHKLLDKNLIEFLGSDIHNKNQLNCLKEIRLNRNTMETVNSIIQFTKRSF